LPAYDTANFYTCVASTNMRNELEQAGVGWISALPWNQAPEELRERPVEPLSELSSRQPGVRATAERLVVQGKQYRCVVKYSAPVAGCNRCGGYRSNWPSQDAGSRNAATAAGACSSIPTT
jgi:hypothetical protein